MPREDEFNHVEVTNDRQLHGVEFGPAQNTEFSFHNVKRSGINTQPNNELNEDVQEVKETRKPKNVLEEEKDLIKQATESSNASAPTTAAPAGSGASATSVAGVASSSAAAAGASTATAATTAAAAGTVVVVAFAVVTAAPVIISQASATLKHFEASENEIFYEVELVDTLEDEKYFAILSNLTYEEKQEIILEPEQEFVTGSFIDLEPEQTYTFLIIEGTEAELTRELIRETISTKPTPEPIHEHTFSSEWTYDENYHWHASTCGHEDAITKQEHTFGDWETVSESTTEEHGLRVRKCTVCDYQEKEELPLHVHTYSSEYEHDQTYHWHPSTCGHDTVSGKEEHAFGEWEIIKESTTEQTGLRTRTCSICQYVEEDSIPLHEHTFSNEYTYDDNYHWYPSTCGHDVVFGQEEHDFGEWVVVSEETTETTGLKQRTCNTCGYVQEEIIPVHVHTYSTDYFYDGTYHWHDSTCGHNVITDQEEHTYGEWKTVKESTTEQTGLRTRTCNTCGYVQEEELPLHVHTYSEDFSYDSTHHWHDATCGHDSVSDKAEHDFGDWVVVQEETTESTGLKQRTCNTCGYVQEEVIPIHVHTYSDIYTHDETYHWHSATCGHDSVSDKAEHDFGPWEVIEESTTEKQGTQQRVCSVCGYVQEELLPLHVHTFAETYSHDDTYHWYESTCGHDVISGKEEHAFSDWTIINEATTEETGLKQRTCSACGYVQEEVIPVHEHTFSEDYSYDSTHHWHEATCGHDVVSGKEEHNFSDWVITTEAGVTTDGSKSRTCNDCGYVETEVIPMTGKSQINEMTINRQASFYENSIFVTIDYIDDFAQYYKFELVLEDSSGFGFIYVLDKTINGESQQIEVSDFNDYIPIPGDETGMMPDEGGPAISSGEAITYTFRYYLNNESNPQTYDSGNIIFEDPNYVPPFSFTSITFGNADFEECSIQVQLSYTGNIDEVYEFELELIDERNQNSCNATLEKTTELQVALMTDGLDLENSTFSYILRKYSDSTYENYEVIARGDSVSFTDINGRTSSIHGITFGSEMEGVGYANSITGEFNVQIDYDDYFGHYSAFQLTLSSSSMGATAGPNEYTFENLEVTNEVQTLRYKGEDGVLIDLLNNEPLTYTLKYMTSDNQSWITASTGTVTFTDNATSQITGFEYGSLVYDDETRSYYLPFKFDIGDRHDTDSVMVKIIYSDGSSTGNIEKTIITNNNSCYLDDGWQLGYFSSDDTEIGYLLSNQITFEVFYYDSTSSTSSQQVLYSTTGTLSLDDGEGEFIPLGLRITNTLTSDNSIMLDYLVYNGAFNEDSDIHLKFVFGDGTDYEDGYLSQPDGYGYPLTVPITSDLLYNRLSASEAFALYIVYTDSNGIIHEVLCYTNYQFSV